MSDLTRQEMLLIERLLGMSTGYVLDFSNRTFEEFVADSVQRMISEAKYARGTGSKANRLRAFWALEPNHVVGKLLKDLLAHARTERLCQDELLWESCHRVSERLLRDAPAVDLGALIPDSPEREFETLVKAVRGAIESNEPEAGLDRLHTFFIKYLRVVCARHGISPDREKPLHSLMGEYVKALRSKDAIESEMTERILRTSIGLLEAFNRVRNEQSLAHDNRVLNYQESLLIFHQVTSVLRFIGAVEDRLATAEAPAKDEIPF